jgi:hypothetical protein
MPVNYQYLDREGNTVDLSRVDDEMCADLSITPNLEDFCHTYKSIMYIGVSILKQEGGTQVTPCKLDAWWRARGADRPLYLYTMLRKYAAGGKYTYTAWQ